MNYDTNIPTVLSGFQAVKDNICLECGGKLEWGPQLSIIQIAACLECHNKYQILILALLDGKVEIDEKGNIQWIKEVNK